MRPLFWDAVRAYWGTQTAQAQKQIAIGGADQGRRGEVTGGQHLDGFRDRLCSLLLTEGVSANTIYIHRHLTVLPGFFRPTKQWDLIVVDGIGRVRVVVELKSIGSSFGNNANNRAEEAVGNAKDLWVAFREGAFGDYPRPWLGYFFVLPETSACSKSVVTEAPHRPVFPEFVEQTPHVRKRSKLAGRKSVYGVSYAKRLELMCRKLVKESLYAESCFILADPFKKDDEINYRCPSEDLADTRFVAQMLHAAKAP
jgi:hypothetical protein